MERQVAPDRSGAGHSKLRQVGIAITSPVRTKQCTELGPRNFSRGKPVDYVETEKSRIVLLEPEPNWWIVAVRCVLQFGVQIEMIAKGSIATGR